MKDQICRYGIIALLALSPVACIGFSETAEEYDDAALEEDAGKGYDDAMREESTGEAEEELIACSGDTCIGADEF